MGSCATILLKFHPGLSLAQKLWSWRGYDPFAYLNVRFTRNFITTDLNKNQNCLDSYVQNYFNTESVGDQSCSPLEVILNEFCL